MVTLAGELDLSNAERLFEHLQLAIDAGADELICDISALSYMDSVGLSVLISAHKRQEHGGGRFIVLAPMPRLRGCSP
jgi:anti-anti-sigma factor